jgi:tetratricopeptide (TPR) repeat protein
MTTTSPNIKEMLKKLSVTSKDATASSPHTTVNISQKVQNLRLVWLDANINKSNLDCRNSLTRLSRVVNSVTTFTTIDPCVDFLNNIHDEKACLIISGSLAKIVIPIVHSIAQLDSIFVFCGNKARHQYLTTEWPKVTDILTHIDMVCTSLYQTIHHFNHDPMPMSFLSPAGASSSDTSLNQSDLNFMYSQLFKEVLLDITDNDERSIKELAKYCREKYSDNELELKKIDQFEQEYRQHSPIWWYSCECFIYHMLNRALGTLDVDIILKMGFFIRDLHRDLEKMHSETIHSYNGQFLTVYRGKTFSNEKFEKLKEMQGGLISFNNFLSTSLNEDVSINFSFRGLERKSGSVGVLFHMTIDPTTEAVPFAVIEKISEYEMEKEILFSTHSVFRIGEITPINEKNMLWRVNLTNTNEINSQLSALMAETREEIAQAKGWYRLNELLIKLGELDKAQKVCDILKQKDTEVHNPALYLQLARITRGQGQCDEATELFEKSIQFKGQGSIDDNSAFF